MRANNVYRKMMLLHNVLNSEEERLCTKVIKERKRWEIEKCWYSEVEMIG